MLEPAAGGVRTQPVRRTVVQIVGVRIVAEQHVPQTGYACTAAHGDLPELSEELACFPGFEPCRIVVTQYENTVGAPNVQPVQQS